ncbi:MAG: ureidoglycolate lyase [Pseudomonadota bacterium]
MTTVIRPIALTQQNFAPFGDVIETSATTNDEMNAGRFSRFANLCSVDVGSGDVSISIVVSQVVTSLPISIDMLERHALGSQAFIPLSGARMILVVAPPADQPDLSQLLAFESNGEQGINYAPGTWHMPLLAFETGQRYLCIDKGGSEPNCDEYLLPEVITLSEAER